MTKPLQTAELLETIESLTASVLSHPVAPRAPEVEAEILDRKTLWARVDGDADLLREIVELFLADCPERLEELRAALALQDGPALARVAHRLKGALGNVSAYAALAAVQRVEASGRAGDMPAVAVALAAFEDALARLTPLLAVCAEEGHADLSHA